MKQRADTKIFQVEPAARKRIEALALDPASSHEQILAACAAAGVKWSLRGVSEWRARLCARRQAEDVVGFYAELQDVLAAAGQRIDRVAIGAALIKLSAWLKDRSDFTPDMLPALLFLQRVTEQKDRVQMHSEQLTQKRESKAEAGLQLIEREIESNPGARAALQQLRLAIDTQKPA